MAEYWVKRWTVPSETSNRRYTVAKSRDGKWGCTCPDYRFWHVACKHIKAVAENAAKYNPGKEQMSSVFARKAQEAWAESRAMDLKASQEHNRGLQDAYCYEAHMLRVKARTLDKLSAKALAKGNPPPAPPLSTLARPGWRRRAPKIPSARREAFAEYGSKAFLDPKRLRYPVVDVHTGRYDPEGILSAYKRARQQHEPSMARKAVALAKRLHLPWALEKNPLARSPWMTNLTSWQDRNLTASGNYCGQELRDFGFPYKRGDWIPDNKRRSAMLEHNQAERAFLAFRNQRMVRGNPKYRVYYDARSRRVIIQRTGQRTIVDQLTGPATKARIMSRARQLIRKAS